MSAPRSSPSIPVGKPPPVVRAIGDGMLVEKDDTVVNWITARPGLADPLGNLRLGAITFVADGAGGLAGGLASRDGTWVVTTDLEVRLVRPVRDGRVRIVGRAVRVGHTTAVCDIDLFDDATGEVLGAGSITNHTLETATAPARDMWRRGIVMSHEPPPADVPIVGLLGIERAGDAAVDIPVGDDLRNPWGILHGGIVAVGAEEAVLRHPAAAGRAPLGMLVRYLAPTRIGPAHFEAELIGTSVSGSLFRVRSYDVGSANRLTSLASVSLGPD